MTIRKHANNFATTLDGAISDVATTVVLTSATGLPAIGAGEEFRLTISSGSLYEIITITDDASSPSFTCTRGSEGSTAQAWSDNAIVQLRETADSLDRKEDLISGRTIDSATVATGDLVLIQDISDSNNEKVVTAQSVADLATPDSDATITTTDVTTNNASTSKHGFLKKLSNVATEYMDGTGAWSTPAGGGGGGGGGMVYLASATASASSELTITSGLSSTYDNYLLVGSGLTCNATANLYLTFSRDGGSTYLSADYSYTVAGFLGATSAGANAYTSQIRLNSRALFGHSAHPLNFNIHVQNPSATGLNNSCYGEVAYSFTGGYTVFDHFHGQQQTTGAIDALKIALSSGTFTTGVIRLYGIVNS